MSTILRKGQIIPKRLGHITVHNKARHGVVAGAMIYWDKNLVLMLTPGVCVYVRDGRRPRSNGTRQRCPLALRDLRCDTRINANRIFVGLAPIPTRANLYARAPSTRHATSIEYLEARPTYAVRVL